MIELIAHPGLRFWVYNLQGSLTYTHYVPSQLPRKYTLYGYEFKGMPEGGEEPHRQKMESLGGIRNSFSVAFSEEMCIVIIRVDGKLDIEYHYREGLDSITEVIYQGGGPWPIRKTNKSANPYTPPYPHYASIPSTGQENVLTPVSDTLSPQETTRYVQETASDMQKTLLQVRPTPPDIQITPPEEQKTPPDTQENSQDTQNTSLDMDLSPDGLRQPIYPWRNLYNFLD